MKETYDIYSSVAGAVVFGLAGFHPAPALDLRDTIYQQRKNVICMSKVKKKAKYFHI